MVIIFYPNTNGLRRHVTKPFCDNKGMVRLPSVPDFSGQSWFLTMCPGKNHSSPWTPICPVFGLVSHICPDLPTCSLMLTHPWPKYRWPGPRWVSSQRSPIPPSRIPNGLRLWLSTLIRTFGTRAGLLCPNCGHLGWGCLEFSRVGSLDIFSLDIFTFINNWFHQWKGALAGDGVGGNYLHPDSHYLSCVISGCDMRTVGATVSNPSICWAIADVHWPH